MKCQPYVSSREAIRLRDGEAPLPYFVTGRGKDKGRRAVGVVNNYTFHPLWASRKLRKTLKTTAHRLYRHQVRKALSTDFDSELPYRISVSMGY